MHKFSLSDKRGIYANVDNGQRSLSSIRDVDFVQSHGYKARLTLDTAIVEIYASTPRNLLAGLREFSELQTTEDAGAIHFNLHGFDLLPVVNVGGISVHTFWELS